MLRTVIATIAALCVLAAIAFIYQARVWGEKLRATDYLGRRVGIDIVTQFESGAISSLREYEPLPFPAPKGSSYLNYRLILNPEIEAAEMEGDPIPIGYLLPRGDVPWWYLYRPSETTLVLLSDLRVASIHPGDDALGFNFNSCDVLGVSADSTDSKTKSLQTSELSGVQ